MKAFFIFLLALSAKSSFAQSTTDTTNKQVKTDTAYKPIPTIINADGSKTFTVVQVEAEFPGGREGWTKYLQANLNIKLGEKYIKIPKGQKQAKQTAILNFLVDSKGYITEAHVDNVDEIHPKLAAEAIRVIKEGPRWKPAVQNGKPVSYRARQTITWMITAE
ncbi:energy transducer TonB [Chitinophagaceae bacterium LWZ2-11]